MGSQGASGLTPAEAFELLSDGTRIEVLRALSEHRGSAPADPSLSYSELKDAVGTRDSGRFNYHLNRLREHFVRKTPDGYELSFAGVQVASAIYSGTYNARGRTERTAIDSPCPSCDAGLEVVYEDEIFRAVCPKDHEAFRTGLPAGAVEGRSTADLVRLVTLTTQQDMERATGRVCPLCYGRMDPSVIETGTGDGARFRFESQCVRCGMLVQTPVGACVVREPAVVAFYHEHGIDIRERPFWTLAFCQPDAACTVVSGPDDPLELRLPIRLQDSTLRVYVDDAGNLVRATS